MSIFLTLIPLLVVMSALYMYRFTGKRELMKMDLVQFVYAFVIAPVMYIWLKIFLFFIVRSELNLRLSLAEIFLLDGIFTSLFLYIFAFVVIHSLTKTFGLKRDENPRYNLFSHSEYFHQLLSHLAIYCGIFLLILFIGLVNLFVPFGFPQYKQILYSMIGFGFVSGAMGFAGVWMYDTPDRRFYRFMKLFFGIAFVIEVCMYIVVTPSFVVGNGIFWLVFAMFFTLTSLSLFAEKPKPDSWWERLPFMINWRKPKSDLKRYYKVLKNTLKK